jgi:hypothetical protein
MEKILLYQYTDDSIKISMEIYFNDQDQLIFDGYDRGKKVTGMKGDYDYEYYYTIPLAEAQRLALLLGANAEDKASCLAIIQQHFSTNDAYSRLGKFMREQGIDYQSYTC